MRLIVLIHMPFTYFFDVADAEAVLLDFFAILLLSLHELLGQEVDMVALVHLAVEPLYVNVPFMVIDQISVPELVLYELVLRHVLVEVAEWSVTEGEVSTRVV